MRNIESGKNNNQEEQPFGERFKAVRQSFGYSTQEVAIKSGVSRQSIHNIEDTSLLSPDSKTAGAAKAFLSLPSVRSSYHAMELREALEEAFASEEAEQEQQDWLRTIHDLPFTIALRALRVSDGLTENEFGKERDMSRKKINAFEKGRQSPRIQNVNSLIATSALEEVPYAAQLLRIKSREGSLLSINDLPTSACNFGTLFNYSLTVFGYSTRDLDKELRQKFNISYASRNIKTDGVRASFLEPILRIFQIPSDDPMSEIMRQKVAFPQIEMTEEQREQLMNGKFLFAEHLAQLPEYPLSSADQDFLQIIQCGARTVQSILNDFRRQLQQRAKYEYRPTDRIITRLAQQCGYTIHHPVTHALLQRADQERKE
jgi:DNA-binding XRE family transcriptional regulator